MAEKSKDIEPKKHALEKWQKKIRKSQNKNGTSQKPFVTRYTKLQPK